MECVTDLKLGHCLMRADEIPVVGYNSLWCACVYKYVSECHAIVNACLCRQHLLMSTVVITVSLWCTRGGGG